MFEFINSRISGSQNTNLDTELSQTFKEKCERLKKRKY